MSKITFDDDNSRGLTIWAPSPQEAIAAAAGVATPAEMQTAGRYALLSTDDRIGIARAIVRGMTLPDNSDPGRGKALPPMLTRDEMAILRAELDAALAAAVPPRVWFAIIDRGAHDGHVTSRDAADVWHSDNEGGWAYQDVTGAHGSVLYEGPSEDQARADLTAYLKCDAAERGAYCYTHDPRPGQ